MEQIISPHYQRMNGKEAWRQNLHTVIFAADKIRSTLGKRKGNNNVTKCNLINAASNTIAARSNLTERFL